MITLDALSVRGHTGSSVQTLPDETFAWAQTEPRLEIGAAAGMPLKLGRYDATTAHDGIARAVRPVHLLNDGDTVFALATGDRPLDAGNPLALNDILAAGADVVTRAIVKALRAAEPVAGPGGTWPSYEELYGAR